MTGASLFSSTYPNYEESTASFTDWLFVLLSPGIILNTIAPNMSQSWYMK